MSVEQPNNHISTEAKIFEGLDDRIITETELHELIKSYNFVGVRRGTFRSESENAFLYMKPCHQLATQEYAENGLKALRYLTERGVIYPTTKWGIVRMDSGKFQLFAVTRKLEPWSEEQNGRDGRQIAKYLEPAETSKTLFDPDSQITSWLQKVPGAEKYHEGKVDEGSLAGLLNIFEAAHRDNWGWDDKGELYPIDVEVISINSEYDQEIITTWINAQSKL